MVVRFALRAPRPPGRAPPVLSCNALITGRLLSTLAPFRRSLPGSYTSAVVPSGAPVSPPAAPRSPRRIPQVFPPGALVTGRLFQYVRLSAVLCVGYIYPKAKRL